ncbi:uncharacterized protein dok1a isoform 2-T2 [Fundulus diaphanus]
MSPCSPTLISSRAGNFPDVFLRRPAAAGLLLPPWSLTSNKGKLSFSATNPTKNGNQFCCLWSPPAAAEWVGWRSGKQEREESSGSTQVHMEDNHIYVSVDEAPQFWVMIQKTDAATRCGLKGSYCLQVEPQSLLLKDAKKKTVVYEWPYELLRRYGADKVAFNIEAGRRCESGPGTFSFETQQAAKIFSLIQSHIQQRATAATAQTPDPEKVTVTSLRAHSPLPKIPDAPSLAAIMDTKLRMQDRRSPAFDNMAKSLEESTSPSEGPPPITLMPLPSVPTHDITSRDKPKSRSDAIYADPNDCYPVSEILTPTTAKYIDPVKVLPLKPPCAQESAAACPAIAESRPNPNINVPDLVYSEVLDSISSDQSKRRAPHTADEPIYSEPVIKADSQCRQTEPKPDPFAHLYAQVCKAATLGKNSASATTSASSSTITSPTGSGGEPVSDVIYDNLGII